MAYLDDDGLPIRRVLLRHTTGPYVGLRQCIGLMFNTGIYYFHTGESRPFGPNGNGDTLNKVMLWPDGRVATLLQLKATNAYVLYQEQTSNEKPEGEGTGTVQQECEGPSPDLQAGTGPGATPDGDTLSALQDDIADWDPGWVLGMREGEDDEQR